MAMLKTRPLLALLFSLFLFSNSFAINSKVSKEQLLSQSKTLTVVNPDSSMLLAEQAITLAKQANDLLMLTKSHHQLGYVLYNLNRYDEAEQQLNLAIEIAQTENFKDELALSYNRLGNVHQLRTNYLKALDCYLLALSINREIKNEPEIARTYVNLANVYSTIGQYQRSIELFLDAMNIHEATGDRDGLAWTSLGIARLFKRIDLPERSMQYAEAALENYQKIFEETGNSVGITLSLNEIGSIHHRMGNYEKALEYTDRVLEINKQNRNLHGQATNYLSLGTIHLDMKNNRLAKENLFKALELKKEISDSTDFALLYLYLGQIEMEEGRLPSAYLFLNHSLQFAQEHRLLPEISETYLSLSELLAKQGDFNAALEAHKAHSAYRDSLNSGEISRLEMQYEFGKREKEQELITQQREALHKVKLARQRGALIFFIIAFTLVGLLATFIFHNYRLKRETNFILLRQNREISRQKIEIETQKEEIEKQRDYVTKQRDQIVDQQRLITDSITYASRIQTAALPGEISLQKLPWESFVLYKPKNIVSGDFYWITTLPNGKILLAATDCTGHGVPGAFMSILGLALLREVAGKPKVLSPSQMLAKLREMVMISLNQQSGRINQADGMDMAVVTVDPNTLIMEYAGAYLPAIVVREGTFENQSGANKMRLEEKGSISLMELRGDKMPIGHHILQPSPFNNQSLQLHKGDMLYLFSDGYADQFGGEKNTKFLLQNFRALLMEISGFELTKQKEVLLKTIEEYQGSQKQVDDMLVLGFKIS